MKIVVIGAGLIGVTTAWFLAKAGHKVIVIDRRGAVGEETSYANGALLTASMAEPWNSPGCWRALLGSLVQRESPMQVRLSALPSLMAWGPRFLWNARTAPYERAALSNVRLALHSLKVMDQLRAESGIEYDRSTRGTLRLFRDQSSLEAAYALAQRRSWPGSPYRKLVGDEVLTLEPGLIPIGGEIAGAIHYPADEVGDAHVFCGALALKAAEAGVVFRLGRPVTAFERRGKLVCGVICGNERVEAERIVIVAGSYSPTLLRQIGVRIPVRPAKGYSITIPDSMDCPSLSIPIVDDALHMVATPLAGALRVVGIAEFAGYDLSLRYERILSLIQFAKDTLPAFEFDPEAVQSWCGLRSLSVDGIPIIGSTPLTNVFVNTGHGHLGWTMAAGSAQMLAATITGDIPPIDPAPYALARFGSWR